MIILEKNKYYIYLFYIIKKIFKINYLKNNRLIKPKSN